MLAVVVSRADEASMRIGEALREVGDLERTEDDSLPAEAGGGTVHRTDRLELRTVADRHLDLVRPAEAFDDPDLLVFASKHAGETGPLLTAHHTGNYGPADHGGSDYALARACPNAHARVLDALSTHAPNAYEVGMEATHHGPTDVGAPSMFVEVGSGPEEWADPAAAEAVARAILDLRGVAPVSSTPTAAAAPARHLVGFGGGHYAPRFERLTRETNWAVGHVAPDWGLDAMCDASAPPARAVIEAAFEHSEARYALLDGDHPDVAETVADLGYAVVTETWLRETDGVRLDVVERLEAEVAPVAEGLRFGTPAVGADGGDRVVSPPPDLLAAANDVDASAVRAGVADRALAFVTAENGTRLAGPVVLPESTASDAVIEVLVAVLRTGYDEVRREDDVVEARRDRFDPDRAADLGVPEGPAFGRLASGTPVEVDGREIDPASVHVEEVDRFEL